MEPLYPHIHGSQARLPEPPVATPVDEQPPADQHSGAERIVPTSQAAIPVVQALAAAWAAESLDVSEFGTILRHYLGDNAFLRISCHEKGLRVDGTEVEDVQGVIGLLGRTLVDQDVVELLFKDGIESRETEEFLHLLRRAKSIRGTEFDNLATLLWEADLAHVAFRCSDELPVNHAREVEVFDLDRCGAGPIFEASQEMVADPKEDSVVSAVVAIDEFPRVDVEELPIHLKQALFLSPEDTLATQALTIPAPEESLNQLVFRLVDVYSSETDEVIREDSRELLVKTIEALLREKRLVQVHELLLWLQSQKDDGATHWHDLVGIVQECICAPQTVLLLGNVLNDRNAASEDVQSVRELLLHFDERTVDPLCQVLEKLESMEARKLVCQVLAVVGAADPAGLARRSKGQPWYVARNLAYVLGRIGTEEVLPHLRQWAVHRDERVRVEVARALSKLDNAESTEILCGLLNDEQYRVRQSAVWALSERADPIALEHLRRLLFEDRDFRERPVEERDDYFRTYGRLVRDGSFQELLDIAQQRQILARGWKFELRRGAMIALAETGRSEVRPILQKNSETRNGRIREAARNALRDLRSRGKLQPGARATMSWSQKQPEPETIAWEEMGE
jgi:HEAT repeat protein